MEKNEQARSGGPGMQGQFPGIQSQGGAGAGNGPGNAGGNIEPSFMGDLDVSHPAHLRPLVRVRSL